MLIIVCGLQGTGKTFVSRKIAEKINAVLLRTDVIRKELIKNPRYSEKEKQKIYDEMFSRAQTLLKNNKNVVLDATFAKRENRNKAKKIAIDTNTDFKIVEVVCPEDIVKRRIEKRFKSSKDESEAKFDTYLKYKRLFEPIEEEHIIIDNSGTEEDTYRQIDKYF